MKLLIVSGNGSLRKQIRSQIESLPFTVYDPAHSLVVCESNSSTKALEQALADAEGGNGFDLVIASQNLMPISGVQLARKLNSDSNANSIPVALCCENMTRDLQKEGSRAGVLLYFEEPVTAEVMQKLMTRVGEYLIGREEQARKATIENLMKKHGNNDFVSQLENIYMRSFRRLKKLIEFAPWSSVPYLALSRICIGQNKHAAAIPYLKTTISIDFTNQEAHRNLVLCYKRTGQSFEEREELEEMLASDPTNPEILLKVGDSYLRDRDYDKAEEFFTKAIKNRSQAESPKMVAKSHIGLGKVYLHQGEIKNDPKKYDAASVEFKRAAQLDPTLLAAYNNLIIVYKRLGKYDEAREVMAKAVEIMPEDAEGWLNLFEIYLIDGEVNKAAYALQQALKYDPENQVVICVAGEVYMRQKMFENALEMFEKAIDINPSDTRLYNYAGICYRRLDRNLPAITNYKKALEIDPKDPIIHYNLAKAYQHADETEQAKKSYQDALALDSTFEEARTALQVLEDPNSDRRKAVR